MYATGIDTLTSYSTFQENGGSYKTQSCMNVYIMIHPQGSYMYMYIQCMHYVHVYCTVHVCKGNNDVRRPLTLCTAAYTCTCRLMRRRIKVADPRIFLIYAAYMHIREEVVDKYHYEHTAVRNVPGIRVVLDC